MIENAAWTRARDLLVEKTRPVDLETVSLDECAGRVLGFDLRSEEAVPPFDKSAYDGYAFRSADTAEASRERPVLFRITETVPAGKLPMKAVGRGEAAHVMTGAPIPQGADCVINFERTEFTRDTVTLFSPLRPGDNIVKKGEDVAEGALLAPRGAVIDAGLSGTLAAQGMARFSVYRRPLIGLISTGSELVEAGEEQTGGKIRNANRSTFTALLKREGCLPRYLGLAGDDSAEIAELIREGLRDCDAVILTGGVSVGDWDVTPEAMERAGAETLVRGVAMKPGMACAYGLAGEKLVLGLSGNPASALTNFCACALPALRRLRGLRDFLPRPFQAALERPFQKKSPCDRFLRGRLDISGGAARFIASGGQGNAMLSSAIGCDAFALIPAGSEPVAAGETISGFML